MKYITVSLGTLLLSCFAFVPACNNGAGGGTLSLDAYFQKVNQVERDNYSLFATRGAALGTPSDSAGGEELAAFLRDGLTTPAAVILDYAEQLDDIDPPGEVADAHNDLVDALNREADAYDRVAAAIPDSITMTEFQNSGSYFTDEDNAALHNVTAACAALQQIARDNEITVELNCV